MSVSRQLAAEFIGTCFLLMTVVGSGIMADQLAGGNVALALLGNTLPTGAILVVLITMFGPISGAHFNPAVTLVFFLKREIVASTAVLFVIVQILGGCLGSWLAHAMPLLQASTTARTGGAQWLAELIATFGLVGTILATLVARPTAVPMAVGLYITAAYWFTASTSFANPAVTIARTLTDTFAGIQPAHAPGFIVAQLIGAVLALAVFTWLSAERRD